MSRTLSMYDYVEENYSEHVCKVINDVYAKYAKYVERDDFEQEAALVIFKLPPSIMDANRSFAKWVITAKFTEALSKYGDSCLDYYSIAKMPEYDTSLYSMDGAEASAILTDICKYITLTSLDKKILYYRYVRKMSFDDIGLVLHINRSRAYTRHQKMMYRMFHIAAWKLRVKSDML